MNTKIIRLFLVTTLLIFAACSTTGDAKKGIMRNQTIASASERLTTEDSTQSGKEIKQNIDQTVSEKAGIKTPTPPPIPKLKTACEGLIDSDLTYDPFRLEYENTFAQKSLFISGKIQGTNLKDYCENSDSVIEYYCEDGKVPSFKSYSCTENCIGKTCACSDGACRVLS